MPSTKFIQGLKNVDTSRSRSSEILREMQQMRNDINRAAREMAEIDLKREVRESPYQKDRAYYKKEKLMDSERETSWKHVSISFDQEQAKINKKKIDII